MAERCDRVEPLLSAHVDGELDAVTERNVASHLATCPACAAEAEATAAVRSLLRSMPVRRLPEGVRAVAPPVGAAVGLMGTGEREGATRLARAGAALAVAGGLLAGAAFSLGGQAPVDTRTVAVPLDVYVADHLVQTVNRAVFTPVRSESSP
jgi:anti-sigma factor RsiW